MSTHHSATNGDRAALTSPEPRLAYSIAVAAQMSCLSYRQVMNFINKGELRARRQGRKILILHQDLAKFLQKDHASPGWRPNGRGQARQR